MKPTTFSYYIISHLKKVFSSDICGEPSSQVLDILEYACGLIFGLASISNKNPNFEKTYSKLNYLNFRRNPNIPIRPEPKSHAAAGMGTALTEPWATVIVVLKSLKLYVCPDTR